MLMTAADAGVAWYALKQGLLFEVWQEYKFKKVCAGLGGKFVGQGRAKFKTAVALDPVSSFTRGKWERQTIYPKLREVRGNAEAWTAIIRPLYGQAIEEYTKNEGSFTLCFNTPYITFEKTDTGLIKMRCGLVQVPETYAYPVEQLAEPEPAARGLALLEKKRELLESGVPLERLFDVRETLKALPIAQDIDGKPFCLPIEGNHFLMVGRTGSGKSSWCWSLVFGLAKAKQAGLVKLIGLDPKRLELAYGMQWWDEYADTAEGMVELLEKAVADMLERNKALQGKARKFTPSTETPLNVIIIDELAYLSGAVDKKLQQRAQTAMRSILWLGRATGFSLVGASQSPLKEVLAERDYYPTKVALAMDGPLVNLVLGDQARENGARCDEIPEREAGAGCAYVKGETGKPVLVRAAWCSDEQIKRLFAATQGMTPEQQYRAYEQGYMPPITWSDDEQPPQQWQHREE